MSQRTEGYRYQDVQEYASAAEIAKAIREGTQDR